MWRDVYFPRKLIKKKLEIVEREGACRGTCIKDLWAWTMG